MSGKKIFRSLVGLLNYLNMNGNAKTGKKAMRVAVEGNIGCGKTTFLNLVAKDFGDKVKVFTEPVNKWRNVGGHNMLDLMYKDPKKWSFAFQQYVQLTMFELHSEMTNYKDENVVLKMCERSLMSARHCFVENLHDSGQMTRAEYYIIDEWYKHIMKDKCTKLDYIIYLETSPEVCLKRIEERGRHEEKRINLDYLKDLHILHENWLKGENKGSPRIIRVDGNRPKSEMDIEYRKCCDEIFHETPHISNRIFNY